MKSSPRNLAIVAALLYVVLVSAIVYAYLFFNIFQSISPIVWILITTLIVAFPAFYLSFKMFFHKKTNERIADNSNLHPTPSPPVGSYFNLSEEITELKKLETFRKEFLGNVSHELKTPIFNIQGYIHTLLDGALRDDAVNVQYLQRAARSAERLSLIVDDLEAISKFESGELILDQRTFDIYDLVKDAYDSNELLAIEKNISLSFKKESEQPFYVYADKERIRQVIVNLVTNSIKYGKEGGSTVTGFSETEENVLVEVTDTGIGMEPKHLPRLFERFYRIDKSRSREAGGTGLGLAIVKHILEAHRQTISVRSTYGAGTSFTFTLKKAK
jgi:two-component system phosphate regulon sensor histidine kinase PhoR